MATVLVFSKANKTLDFIEDSSWYETGYVQKNEKYFVYIDAPADYVEGDVYRLNDDNTTIRKLDTTEIEKEEIDKLIPIKIDEIKRFKDKSLQTIPAEIRKAFGKKGAKYYNGSSWIFFLATCDRISHRNVRDDRYLAATWVTGRIDVFDVYEEKSIKNLYSMSLDVLKAYNVENDTSWVDVEIPGALK